MRMTVNTLSCGQALVRLLEDYGVEVVFGIPGVHTMELYRGLERARSAMFSPVTSRAPHSWPTVMPGPPADPGCAF